MRKQILTTASILSSIILFYSCQKSIEKPIIFEMNRSEAGKLSRVNITPYQFERINENNFHSQGWREQQVNNLAGGIQAFSDESDYVKIVCGPENNNDPRLIYGCITMDLPTSTDPTLRRVRLRRGGYSGTRLADLTELKYSTYIINNAPTIMVLQVDAENDGDRDLNIFYNPQEYFQGDHYLPIVFNTWQQWDALHGLWHVEVATIEGLPEEVTMEELLAIFPDARIIDTPPAGHNGEGVRFTIGGTPRYLFDNTVGYFDALIIGTKNQQHSTLFDFSCNHSHH